MAPHHLSNDNPHPGNSQVRPRFSWPDLHKHIEFYEKERLRYFPLIWGRKEPGINLWKPFQSRAPTFEELTEWFQEGKPTNVAIICGAASNGLVALCFNALDGAIEFFGQKLWDRLLTSTFIVKTLRGVHVYLRSGTPIPTQFVAKGANLSWLEIRADGNYIAAPPSLHPSGILYEAIGVEKIAKPKNLPDFIVQQLAQLGLKARLAQEAKEKPLEPKEVVSRRKKHPPCLEIISNGVEEQQREAAALALARHYLIQAYEPGEVFWLLQEWGKKNKPPSYDETFLENTVRSAEKYRGLICHLIKENPTVSTFCVGEEKCDWPKPKKLEEEPSTSDEEPEKLNKAAVKMLLETCAFIQHCRDDAASLSEHHWWSMCAILSFFGEPGREETHKLSQPYPKYTKETTDKKLEYAKKAKDKDIGPHTCAHIEKNLGFSCPVNCKAKQWKLKSPVVLANRLARFGNLPLVFVTDRFLREKTADTIAAVEQANKPPQIFERSGCIVRIAHDECGTPYIETLTESACRGFLERAACYVRLSERGKMVPLPAPPLDIVRDYMSLPNRKLPALLNVTEVPVLRSDGTIVTEPGYDEVSRLYYEPAAGLIMPAVPGNPGQKELDAAAALIQEPIINFPFDTKASRTNALAVVVTPIYRPMIAGLVPLCLLDKPQPGTGAGLLSDVIATIATGRQAVMMAPPRTDEECEKRLASILLHGQAIVTIDNIEGYLYFASLAMLLTAPTFQTRILGQTKEVRLPNRATYIVTGNNVRLGGDMPRRCYLCRMDARLARPWMRDPKSFKYHHLIQWVKENRGRLLAAALTLARAWVQAGKPIPDGLPPLGSFEDWTNTVGGVLAHAGLTDFLGNLDYMYQKADVETPQWEGFLTAWQETLGKEAVTTAQVVKATNEYEDFADALPDAIDRDPKKINRSLSHSLARKAGVRYSNGLMVTKSEKMVHHVTAWQVINYQEEDEKRGISIQQSFSYESGTEGGLGGLPYKQRSYTPKNEGKEEKEIYKSGLEHNPPNPLLATAQAQSSNPPFSDDLWAGMPDYPHEPCPTCGGTDFWPDFENKRFVCSRCHPQPPEIDMEV